MYTVHVCVCITYEAYWMVGPQMEQVWGEDGRSKETQEDEAAHCCVSDILVN